MREQSVTANRPYKLENPLTGHHFMVPIEHKIPPPVLSDIKKFEQRILPSHSNRSVKKKQSRIQTIKQFLPLLRLHILTRG